MLAKWLLLTEVFLMLYSRGKNLEAEFECHHLIHMVVLGSTHRTQCLEGL